MKKELVKLISTQTKIPEKEIAKLIEIPPKESLGDYAFPCFVLAKKLKKSPIQIAEDLTEKFRKNLPREITNVGVNAGYVNFFIDKKILAEKVLKEVKKEGFGFNNSGKGKTIAFDMSSPNIAKPFVIGSLRSTIIGNSLAKISRANGYKIVRINHLGDWGTQFGKMILGYKKFGDEKKLEKDSVNHLYEIYIKGNAKELEKEARNEFKKLEEGEKENLALWKKFKKLSLKEFDRIYKILGVNFEVTSGESDANGKMQPVIDELEKKKLSKIDDGANIVDLKKEGLGVALIQKSDGASLYHTRDIYVAIQREKKYGFHKMIYEVGQEQTLYFRQLFKILEKMNYSWAKDCIHVGHGLYLDKDGKKFATRKGKTLFLKDILNGTIEKAKKNLVERSSRKLSREELERRAQIIAVAAIFYGDLKVQLRNDVMFDTDKFLAFEGDTGPYLLYSYARANSIIKKVKSKKPVKIVDLKESEIKLLKKINVLPEVVENAYKNLSPNLIANYAYELAKLFNEFYHDCPVMGSIEEGFRLKLVEAFKIALGKALDLLGIEVLLEM